MFLDLAITISIATPIVFVFMVLYIQALLGIAWHCLALLDILMAF
jgi:hypothetical protein